MFPLFDKLISKNSFKNLTYVEPFAGGAGAALALLVRNKVKRIVINDLDRAIYAFWKAAIYETDEFIERIHRTSISISEWHKQRDVYINPQSKGLKLGFATFFLNRTNMSGIIGARPIGGLKQNGKWKMDARFNKLRLSDSIQILGEYRQRIRVSNQDGTKLIKRYLKSKKSLIYLDPPYVNKGNSLYFNNYDESDHIELSQQLNKNPNSKWILTYDNNKLIKSLYRDRKQVKYSPYHNAYRSQKGQEILIFSDSLAN